ncbi:hypothetical protein DEU56DRAFT_907406 [Suillus clintonianus]|uniref:uncharacterized protein n=1 Tax=Suillus clintonianus TaxID=1904413 RepID=UPI001B85F3E0|nr:uncharacterized protein DEU56DRAFT_907406 [Suillus clintonianus]KAG2153940.1 hypothetical protein DEU56DRAFT_907406 [Suillus clintonianus]
MRSQSIAAALSIGSAALALHDQFPVNTAGETGVRPLDITISTHPGAAYSVSSNSEQWKFDEYPLENATGNLIFDTVHSFLQHWPNTRYRNGHNIVPGVIPVGTLLYHGTNGSQTIPNGPEWTSTDPEHSIFFARGNGSGWHLTLAATRPLKVLYFDGSSAAKLPEGTMDIQDIIIWGEPRPERFFDERDRIEGLCTWGKEFGIDGFARLDANPLSVTSLNLRFLGWKWTCNEVMLCDFTAGVKVVSFLHLILPKDERSFPHPTPLDSDTGARTFEVLHSGSWHNRYPGDSRIVLDLTGLISLYDIALAPSLIPVRAGLERCDHRVLGISSDDISRVMKRLTEVITRPDLVDSGIDWKTLTHTIVDRYADRLELMQYLLNFTSSDSQELLQRAKLAQTQFRVMLTPYLLQSTVVPSEVTLGIGALRWASPIFKLCATTHTSEMINQTPSMTYSERLLLDAVKDTTREICRVTTKMWANGVMSGLDTLFHVERYGDGEVTRLMNDWRRDIQKLMSWLDWSVWIKCRPACGPEEMCYLPSPRPKHPPPQNLTDAPEAKYFADQIGPPLPEGLAIADTPFFHVMPAEDMRKPQPICIRRLQPYG